MTAGFIFDYGGTLDTGGQHWGQVLWHAYERHHVPVSEAQFREAYVHAERMLGSQHIIQPDFTFRQTLEAKLRLQLEYLGNLSPLTSHLSPLLDDLYSRTVDQTHQSREVLLQLKDKGLPMALVIESAVVGIRKPDPRIFLLGVDALGLKPEEVTVVGDSLDKDIFPAHEAGCQTVWLRGEGWTPVSHNGDCPYCEKIDSLDELLEMIKTK